jgi:cell division septation protein DedD
MSKLDKDQVIAKFTQAYTAANGKAPEIEAKGGWYSVDGGKNIRLADLDTMADEISKPAKASTAKKADKPAAKVEKPAAKAAKPAPKPAKKPAAKTSGFSVKTYWAEQVEPGSRSPR